MKYQLYDAKKLEKSVMQFSSNKQLKGTKFNRVQPMLALICCKIILLIFIFQNYKLNIYNNK